MSVEALRTLFDDHIIVTTSSGTTPPDQVSALSPLLPEETPLGYDSWAEKRRREFRAGRHHAKHALLAAGAPSACILRDADGVPQFPSGFSGSITHTGRSKTYAAAIVTREEAQVGLDAEELRELPVDMVAHILSTKERRALDGELAKVDPALSREGLLALLAFSAKEAFYKCVFPRVRCQLGFHDVEFAHLKSDKDGGPGEFQIVLLRNDMPATPPQLWGRYTRDGDRIVCGVIWKT